MSSQCKSYLSFKFFPVKTKKVIERIYPAFLGTLAEIGGIQQVIFVSGWLVYLLFSSVVFKQSIVKKFEEMLQQKTTRKSKNWAKLANKIQVFQAISKLKHKDGHSH